MHRYLLRNEESLPVLDLLPVILWLVPKLPLGLLDGQQGIVRSSSLVVLDSGEASFDELVIRLAHASIAVSDQAGAEMISGCPRIAANLLTTGGGLACLRQVLSQRLERRPGSQCSPSCWSARQSKTLINGSIGSPIPVSGLWVILPAFETLVLARSFDHNVAEAQANDLQGRIPANVLLCHSLPNELAQGIS